jgi:hypothetical protein
MTLAYRFMSGAGFLTVLKALIKMTFCRPHPLVMDGTGPLVAVTDYSIACWSPEHLRYVVIALGCLCVFFPSASLTCLFRYDDDDDRGFGSRPWRAGTIPYGHTPDDLKPPNSGPAMVDGRPIHRSDHRRGYSGAFPMQKGCVAGGEDMRWLHLWRRIEYLVKVCWVFAGYRMSNSPNAVAGVLLGGSSVIAFVNAKMKPSNLQYVNLWKLEIHCANIWTTLSCLYANSVGFPASGTMSAERAHWIVLVSGWVIITGILVCVESRVVSRDVFLLDCDTSSAEVGYLSLVSVYCAPPVNQSCTRVCTGQKEWQQV